MEKIMRRGLLSSGTVAMLLADPVAFYAYKHLIALCRGQSVLMAENLLAVRSRSAL
jgi:hypothetical protein